MLSRLTKNSDPDFDEEARRLWDQLNLDPTALSRGKWNPLDPIYRDKETGGTIYVGNMTAAQDLSLLQSKNITHVVNCTHGDSALPNYHERSKAIAYYRFPISSWHGYVDATDNSVSVFVKDLFAFIEGALAKGESVMVHCLAGAHRAGTTGVSCLIHFTDLDVHTAIAVAQQCRSIIDPIGSLSMFLQRLHRAKHQSSVYPHRNGSVSNGRK